MKLEDKKGEIYMELTEEQTKLVEDHYLLAMKICNDYWRKNRNLLVKKKITKEDLEQIALTHTCIIATKYKKIRYKFSTYLHSCLGFAINREVQSYNVVKIPRFDNWKPTSEYDDLLYNSIYNGELSELDYVFESSKDDDESSTRVDTLETNEIDGIEWIELEDFIWSSFSDEEARVIFMMLEGYPNRHIGKELGIKPTKLKDVIENIKTKILNEAKE